MIIEKLSSMTIKVTISKYDMKKYDLDFGSLSENNSKTEKFLRYVLKEILFHLGINLFNESLYIEAFSCSRNNCIFYISVTDARLNEEQKTDSEPEKNIIESGNSTELILFSKDFIKYYSEYCIGSSLYHKNNIYRLIIETLPEKSESIADCASGYGLRRFQGNIRAAETYEYFDCIIKNSAAEKLSGKISLE